LYYPSGYALTSFNFVEGDWSEANGLYPGGFNGSKFLQTNVQLNLIIGSNSARFGVCFRPINTGPDGYQVVGAQVDGQQLFVLYTGAAQSGDYFGFECFTNGSGAGSVESQNPPASGFFLGNRSSNSNSKIWANNSVGASIATTDGTLPGSLDAYLFAINQNNLATRWGNRGISHAAIGLGLTDAQCLEYSAAVLAKEAALGRSI
jgi:hypothetical protein